jgi:hypothetical protein
MSNPTNFWDVLALLLGISYNLAILGGTTYLVAERGWNPWWYVLAICLLSSVKIGTAASTGVSA